jgi:hypothetical protein
VKTAVFLLLLLVCSHFSFAAEADLAQHGRDLRKASFPVRHKFEKTYGKSWLKASYNQRKKFLLAWYKEEENKAKQEIKDKKRQEKEELQRIRDKKEEEERLADLRKEEEKALEREHRKTVEQRKAFSRAVRANAQSIKTQRSSTDNSRNSNSND